MRLSVVIQAGGKSTRMGENKAFSMFDGQMLIQRVLQRVEGLGQETFLTVNRYFSFPDLDIRQVEDIFPGTGALGGLYTALESAANPMVLVVGCDMPFLSRELLKKQIELFVDGELDVLIPRTSDGFEPLHAVYRKRTCLPAILRSLQQKQKRLVSWFNAVNVGEMSLNDIQAFDPDLASFFNINTPQDLLQAQKMIKQRPHL